MLKIANTVQFKNNISDMRMYACKNTCLLQSVRTSLCLFYRFWQSLAQEGHLDWGHIRVSRWTGELERTHITQYSISYST